MQATMNAKFKDEEDLNEEEDEQEDVVDSSVTSNLSEERDEVKEVRKQSEKETTHVRLWRVLVTLALLATAVVVTVTTYILLVNQEDENFRNVYFQFARAVGDAAVDQQATLREALRMFDHSVSNNAMAEGNGTSPWPYYILPNFEILAQDFKKIANAEFVSIQNFVTHDQREAYVDFITTRYEDFTKEAHMQKYGNLNNLNNDTKFYQPYIAMRLPNGTFVPDIERPHYVVRTVASPPARRYGPTINNNLITDEVIGGGMAAAMQLRNESVYITIKPFTNLPEDEHLKMHSSPEGASNPHSFTFYPIHKIPGDPSSEIVAMFALATAWDVSMLNLLPDNVKGMICVIRNTCNQTVTYRIDGKDAWFLGDGDLHRLEYDDMGLFIDLNLQTHPEARSTPGHCMYWMNIYPSRSFEDDYKTSTPIIFATVVAGTFLMVAIVYFIYDVVVQRRNEKMIADAAKSNAIVSSFVPDHLRDRLLQEKADQQAKKKHGNLKTFLNDGKNGSVIPGKPLADLFLDCTVLFADISGFTAWSSVREPTQVFTLLETLFQAFDKAAKRRRIFKVETVGDCYVCVSGLPEPRADHAVAMARFAALVLHKMRLLTKKLECTLGPDTGDLDLRIGMHTGPVTAGVLRGDRSRFQLFGDTMNTCARLESSGARGRIHTSKETADQIIQAGKGEWLQKREDQVSLKGKGYLESYWVNVHGEQARSTTSADSDRLVARNVYGPRVAGLDEKTNRLIDWNVEMLLNLMKQVVAKRDLALPNMNPRQPPSHQVSGIQVASIPLEEVREIITLPEFDEEAEKKQQRPENVVIPPEVIRQLHSLVSKIASMYNDNPFHNFDHASHVVMSVIKLMSRIVAPSHLDDKLDTVDKAAARLHDHTYGITSDPLTQFACAFSALIHDVDHLGVSNAQLVAERVPLVERYGERSVAEQNSLDLSWDLLMSKQYDALRAFLFPTKSCLVRFRQLVVNSVMSTDIVDKEMKALRNGRWEKAFKTGEFSNHVDENPRDETNRKATIVIEHIIQASDISHTMQHWHVYRKWNQNLFDELYVAYLNEKMDKDPAEFWYKGEFGFFDYYIIPLTQKLKDCGVFGVSSGEYLDYAKKNREHWENEGEEAVAQMIAEAREKYGVKGAVKSAALPKKRVSKVTFALQERAPEQALEIMVEC